MPKRIPDAHRTASIRRPRSDTPPAPPRSGPRRVLDDLTRPLPAEKRLVLGARNRAMIALLAVATFTALVAMLFVLPVKSWIHQGDDLAKRQHDLDVLRDANAALQAEITRLNTDAGSRQAAREQLGYVDRGEQRYLSVGDSTLSLTMPTGWPFDTVGAILAARAVVVPGSGPPAPAETTPAP